MISRKKTILFLLFVILIPGLILLFVLKKPQIERLISRPTPPQVRIPTLFEGKPKIELTMTKEDFNFPESTPFLNVSQTSTLTKDEVAEIAKNLDFESEPIIAEDVYEGTTYIYSEKRANLTAWSKSRKIQYMLNQDPKSINKKLSNEIMISLAKDFLDRSGFISSDNLEFSGFSYLTGSKGGQEGIFSTTKEKATFYQLSFYPKVSDKVILTLNPQNSIVNVWILPDGTVFRVEMIKVGEISKSSREYRVKSYEEVVSSLDSAIIISLDDGNINIPDLSREAISSIRVNEVDIAYLMDSFASTTFQPVFLLKGTASLVKPSDEVNALLYLPALSSSSQP